MAQLSRGQGRTCRTAGDCLRLALSAWWSWSGGIKGKTGEQIGERNDIYKSET